MNFVEKLFSLPGRGVKTFAAMQKLDRKLNAPHKFFKSVHVGGTNGKGSVATKIAKALEAEGFKVGLYTSPHLIDFKERIQINGEMILQKRVQEILERLFSLVEEELSFFDLMTAMAFLYFKEEKVDWAVIEVGLGGRLDATNVIYPELSVIASIGYDHMEILGDSLEKIAYEKKGIVKPGIPLVVGPSAAPFFPNAVKCERKTFYDEENQAIAKSALEILKISEASISKGLLSRPPCRFELRGNAILDVAHNLDGFKKLIDALDDHFPNEKFHFAVAFSKEKDWKSCLNLIWNKAARVTAARVDYSRLVLPEEIKQFDEQISIGSIEEVLESQERIVICGSFYLMEAAIREIQRKEGARGRLIHR